MDSLCSQKVKFEWRQPTASVHQEYSYHSDMFIHLPEPLCLSCVDNFRDIFHIVVGMHWITFQQRHFKKWSHMSTFIEISSLTPSLLPSRCWQKVVEALSWPGWKSDWMGWSMHALERRGWVMSHTWREESVWNVSSTSMKFFIKQQKNTNLGYLRK